MMLFISIPAFTQITLDFETPLGNLNPVNLSENETKYYLRDQQTLHDSLQFSLYNLDGTLFKTIHLPPAPVQQAGSGEPCYISRTLFDNDPATIEYAVQYNWDSIPGKGIHESKVIREDGTILLDEPYGALYGVYSTSEGAKIMFSEYWYGNWSFLPYYTRVYSLPGTLLSDNGDRSITGMPSAKLFPNPNQGSFYIEVENAGNTPSKIELYSSGGKLVGKYSFDGVKSKIDAPALPNGMYFIRTGPRNQNRVLKMVVDK